MNNIFVNGRGKKSKWVNDNLELWEGETRGGGLFLREQNEIKINTNINYGRKKI